MGLLTLQEHKLVLDPHALDNPVLNKIWEADKSKGKTRAYKELLYVYYVADFQSPYENYSKAERVRKITDDVRDGVPATPEIEAAIVEYEAVQLETMPTLKLLRAARESVHKLADWLHNISYEGEDAMDPAKVAKTLGEVGKIIDSLNKLEEKVKKEITTTSRARGGGRKGLYEE